MSKYSLITLLLFITGCATPVTKQVQIPIVNEWHRVLVAQPIISGNKVPTYDDIAAIKAKVSKFKYKADIDNWGVRDYWATPKELTKKQAGDCEDLVTYEYYGLRKSGFSKENLEFWIVESADILHLEHAILLVKLDNTKYILDNRLPEIIPWDYVKNTYILGYNLKEQTS